MAILFISVAWLTGCGKTLVIMGESKVVKMNQGQAVPFEGYLLTPAAMSDLLECCEAAKK